MTKDEFTDLVGIEYADEYEKAQLSQEGTTKDATFSCSHENDTISRQAAIDALNTGFWGVEWDKALATAILKDLPPAQPENQVHLCDSCRHVYPECPSEKEDVIFGNGKGNDNICACNKYEPSAQPEREKGEWIEVLASGMPALYHEKCNTCVYAPNGKKGFNFCPVCGADMRGVQDD